MMAAHNASGKGDLFPKNAGAKRIMKDGKIKNIIDTKWNWRTSSHEQITLVHVVTGMMTPDNTDDDLLRA